MFPYFNYTVMCDLARLIATVEEASMFPERVRTLARCAVMVAVDVERGAMPSGWVGAETLALSAVRAVRAEAVLVLEGACPMRLARMCLALDLLARSAARLAA